jgi:hypothetical protein
MARRPTGFRYTDQDNSTWNKHMKNSNHKKGPQVPSAKLAKAIESAEYLAQAAETFMTALAAETEAASEFNSASADRCGAAYICTDEAEIACTEAALADAHDNRQAAERALSRAICEFRKSKSRPWAPGLTDIVQTGDPEDPTPRQYISAWLQEQLDLLPDFGWMDGGCFALAKALQKLGEKHGVVAQMHVFFRENGSPDHFLVGVRDGSRVLCLDGDGFADRAEVLRKMREDEGVDGYLGLMSDVEIAQIHAVKSFWYDTNVVDELVARLDATFGATLFDGFHRTEKESPMQAECYGYRQELDGLRQHEAAWRLHANTNIGILNRYADLQAKLPPGVTPGEVDLELSTQADAVQKACTANHLAHAETVGRLQRAKHLALVAIGTYHGGLLRASGLTPSDGSSFTQAVLECWQAGNIYRCRHLDGISTAFAYDTSGPMFKAFVKAAGFKSDADIARSLDTAISIAA